MKLRTIAAASLSGLLFCACGLQEPQGGADNGDNANMTIRAGLASVQSKTWLDYAAGGSPLKVYWSDGDRINVNGQASLPVAVADGDKKSEADFQLPDLAAPFNIIYPHEIVKESSYDAKGTIAVELPSVQAYDSGSFANGAAVMYGHAQTPDKVTLHNLCAAVRVPIKKGTDDIVEARLFSASKDAPLCGTFRFSPETGALVAVEGKDELKLDIEEISLNQEKGTDFYFCIPAGNYPEGLTFFFTRKGDRRQMQNIWHPESALEAGKLYSFNAVDYVPMAKDIETVEEWEEFATAMNSDGDLSKYLYKGDLVRLGADLTADNLTSVTKEFSYVFDGNGKTITRKNAADPLFHEVSGEIRNLTLAGELKLDNYGAPFVRTLDPGGKITDCTNKMNVNFELVDKAAYIAGFAAVLPTADVEGDIVTEISGCTNSGAITGTVTYTDGVKYNVAIGGVVGDVRAGGDAPYSLVLDGCRNYGEIRFTPVPPGDHTTMGMTFTGIGGVAGWLRNSKSVTLDDCDNYGNITLSAEKMTTDKGMKAYSICMGGIIGCGTNTASLGLTLSGHNISLTGCDNSGVLYNCGDNYSTTATGNNKIYTGGIAGSLVGVENFGASLESCTNSGNIFTYDLVTGDQNIISARPAYNAVAGGLIGYGGNLNMDKCKVDCQIGNGRRPMVAWGGVVGFLVKPFILNDSSLALRGYFQRISTYKYNRAVIANVPVKCGTVAEDVSGSEITGTLSVSGYLLSAKEISSDDKSDQSSTLTTKLFNSLDKVKSNLVYGEGFTANSGVDYESATITYTTLVW